MTKSFTATAVLLLRDRGLLHLDDPAAAYVTDAPAGLTVRHLLTMSGGLLTDDPWGDRNESQTPEEFAELVAGGITVGGPPGVRFEYSNLGYAFLGRVIDAVLPPDGGGFREFVLNEITGPLGMAATTYDVRGVGPRARCGLSRPRRRVEPAAGRDPRNLLRDGRSAQPRDSTWRAGSGASPTRSAVRTQPTRWGRPAAARCSSSTASPASRAGWPSTSRPAAPHCRRARVGYGFGLFVEHHSDHGHVVHHSGGYPGYGSHMRWHPETGLGVVALANGTYAGPVETAHKALRALVSGERSAPRRPS